MSYVSLIMELPDRKYIEQLSQGNQKAFDDLFTNYYKGLCLFARRYLYNLETAEETVQDVFVKFWEKRNQLGNITSIKTYLFTSVRNACIDIIRKDNVRKKYANEVLKNSSDIYEPEFIPDHSLSEKIKEAVQQLPKQRKKIFIMNKTYGLRYKEIAEKLDLSPKTVENQMGIAIKQLRGLLKDCMPVLLFFINFFNPLGGILN